MPKASYTAVILDGPSRGRLLSLLPPDRGWKAVCHHMTINMGPASSGPAAAVVGETVRLVAMGLGRTEKVVTASVTSPFGEHIKKPHVTLAVNVDAGGKPADSNRVNDWEQLADPIELLGTVTEIF